MPGQRLLAARSRLVTTAVLAVLAVVAVLLTTVARGGAASTGTAPPATHLVAGRPLVAFLGDSWTAGVGATGRRGYVVRTAEELGWGYANFGVGGSGYSVGGPHHSRFAERVADVAAVHPDLVVVQGSLNERRSTPGRLRPAAADTLAELRDALGPGVPVLVVGASYNPGTPGATIDWINTAVGQAAAGAGLPFLDVSGWLDPGDPALWSDSIHPDDAGHQLVADRLAARLRSLAPASL